MSAAPQLSSPIAGDRKLVIPEVQEPSAPAPGKSVSPEVPTVAPDQSFPDQEAVIFGDGYIGSLDHPSELGTRGPVAFVLILPDPRTGPVVVYAQPPKGQTENDPVEHLFRG